MGLAKVVSVKKILIQLTYFTKKFNKYRLKNEALFVQSYKLFNIFFVIKKIC